MKQTIFTLGLLLIIISSAYSHNPNNYKEKIWGTKWKLDSIYQGYHDKVIKVNRTYEFIDYRHLIIKEGNTTTLINYTLNGTHLEFIKPMSTKGLSQEDKDDLNQYDNVYIVEKEHEVKEFTKRKFTFFIRLEYYAMYYLSRID
jgi:hypothetical protein